MNLKEKLDSNDIKKKFEEMLGKKAAGFISSILSAVNANVELRNSDPMSIISSAAVAASLDLPINPSLGFAHIVPYKGKDGIAKAQFQMGWKGYVQLAQRSAYYQTINVTVVHEGELLENNPFTGELRFSKDARASDKIIGYVAYFKMLNGFEKYLYMTVEECQAHGKKYSRSYAKEYSKWQQDFDAMALKTVIKMLLSKYGLLSIGMETAIRADQAVVTKSGEYEYDDNCDTAAVPKVSAPKELQKPTEQTTFNGPEISVPQTKQSLPDKTETQKVTTGIKEITQKPGKNNSVRYKIAGESEDFFTFDSKYAEFAKTAQGAGLKVEIQYNTGKFGNDITGMDIVEPGPVEAAGD